LLVRAASPWVRPFARLENSRHARSRRRHACARLFLAVPRRSDTLLRVRAVTCATATSTRVFDHYETEYLKLTKAAATDIELVDQLLPGIERDSTAKTAKQAIEAAEEIVQSMDLEARSLSGEAKQMMVAQAKDYKMGIAALKQKLKSAQTSSRAQEAARNELLSSADPMHRQEADNQRSRLMATNERAARGTEKLKAVNQVLADTQAVGESIMLDLENQRNTIARSRATLAGASAGLDRSKRLLQGMGRRALQNKILMIVIIIFLVLMIGFIVWFNWFYHPPPPSPPLPPQPPSSPAPPPPALLRLRA